MTPQGVCFTTAAFIVALTFGFQGLSLMRGEAKRLEMIGVTLTTMFIQLACAGIMVIVGIMTGGAE